jgi:hypothetical protein
MCTHDRRGLDLQELLGERVVVQAISKRIAETLERSLDSVSHSLLLDLRGIGL